MTQLSKGARRLLRHISREHYLDGDRIRRPELVALFVDYPDEIESSIAEALNLNFIERAPDEAIILTAAGYDFILKSDLL